MFYMFSGRFSPSSCLKNARVNLIPVSNKMHKIYFFRILLELRIC